MRNYFCGWYFRCQADHQTLAVIPSIHKTRESQFSMIQLISDTQVFHTQFPLSDFQRDKEQITIAGNRFGKDGIDLNIHTHEFHAAGSIRFGQITPIRYDIMGPFRYVPFMQCRHSVYSMQHCVDGELSVNGCSYVFQNGTGYIEGDRGYSFPKEYVWTQCSFSDGALMLSIADIPMGILHFTGIICVVYLKGKEYRLATYLGAKAVKIQEHEIIIQQGSLCLIVKPQRTSGHPLRAPVEGAMNRTIHENPSCSVYYRFEDNGIALLELEAPNAAFEYEY